MTDIEKVARAIVERLIAAIEFECPPIRDGVGVGRRTAILEQLAHDARAELAAMQPAPQEPVAWMYEYGGGTVACTTTRYEPAALSALGYTETPLYAFPTPPAGGSDAER